MTVQQAEDIYSRVHRRPTPHKKKHKPRHSDTSLPPPPGMIRGHMDGEDRHLLVHSDQLEKGECSILLISTFTQALDLTLRNDATETSVSKIGIGDFSFKKLTECC